MVNSESVLAEVKRKIECHIIILQQVNYQVIPIYGICCNSGCVSAKKMATMLQMFVGLHHSFERNTFEYCTISLFSCHRV